MATGTYPSMDGTMDNTSSANFIPEIWDDEVIASYKSNLVMGNLVKKMPMNGKKGDTIFLPKPTRGQAYAKAEGAAVTIQNPVNNQWSIALDQHWEYTTMIEDITAVQAFDSMRQHYTDDAGYALATQVDNDLYSLGKNVGDGDGTNYVNSGVFYASTASALSAYAIDTVAATDYFTDAIFRGLIQKLDDADVPGENRCFVIPPVLRNAIMGIDRYVSSDFVNSGKVPGGKVGELYGVSIYISSNVPVIEAAGDNTASAVDTYGAMLFHKDAFVLAEQMGVRSQTQYKQEFLADMYTADTIYGFEAYRPEAGFVLAVPNAVA